MSALRWGVVGRLELSHPFFADGRLRDAAFVMPDDTLALMRGARIEPRVRDGVLHLLAQRRGEPAQGVLPEGPVLWIGVQPRGDALAHVTQPLVPMGMAALFANDADPAMLSPARAVKLAGGWLRHRAGLEPRPDAVVLRDAAGHVVSEVAVPAGDDEVALDLRALPSGRYRLEEREDDAVLRGIDLLRHPALAAEGPPVVVGLALGAALAAAVAPAAWRITFAAATQPLEYYVVARNFAAQEFAQLQVRDEGFEQDGRPRIEFDRIEQGALDPAVHLTPGQVGATPGSRIALFRSREPVARHERARRRLELARQNTVLVAQLPQPDAARALSRFVIHVAKP